MKKITQFLGLAVVAAMISSCSITVPVAATSNPVGGKVGKASGNCYLNLVCVNVDASIMTAAKNGGISKISTVDYKYDDLLGIIQTHECIVTGE